MPLVRQTHLDKSKIWLELRVGIAFVHHSFTKYRVLVPVLRYCVPVRSTVYSSRSHRRQQSTTLYEYALILTPVSREPPKSPSQSPITVVVLPCTERIALPVPVHVFNVMRTQPLRTCTRTLYGTLGARRRPSVLDDSPTSRVDSCTVCLIL